MQRGTLAVPLEEEAGARTLAAPFLSPTVGSLGGWAAAAACTAAAVLRTGSSLPVSPRLRWEGQLAAAPFPSPPLHPPRRSTEPSRRRNSSNISSWSGSTASGSSSSSSSSSRGRTPRLSLLLPSSNRSFNKKPGPLPALKTWQATLRRACPVRPICSSRGSRVRLPRPSSSGGPRRPSLRPWQGRPGRRLHLSSSP